MGSHVSDEFTKNYNVTILDKKTDNILKNQKFLHFDINNKSKLSNIIKSFDVIYYFADIADIAESKIKYMETINQNIISLSNILAACVNSKKLKNLFMRHQYTFIVNLALFIELQNNVLKF